jgi:hypothetical protein
MERIQAWRHREVVSGDATCGVDGERQSRSQSRSGALLR